jgi:LacI family transcriptional regulator
MGLGANNMSARKQVTIRQVAAAAGVSTQTVSRVVNDHPDVADETRMRVQQVIAKLGYRPNAIARSLIHRRSHTLGVVATGLDYFGPSRALVGIEKQTRALGYSLLLDLLHHPEVEDVDQLLNRLLSHQVDGIIWAVPEIGNNRVWLQKLRPHLAAPMIFLTTQSRLEWATASIDNRRGGYLATQHLLDQGYRDIGIVLGPWTWWEVRQRQLGWREALQEAGMSIEDRQIEEGDWSAASGEMAMESLLEKFTQMDAVFVCNDQMALGVLKAARRSGRRVPEDLGVVGFDNIPEADFFGPALTTVDQPLIELGCVAVEELSRMIEAAHDKLPAIQPQSILLQTRLVIRESSLRKPERQKLSGGKG